MSLLTAHLYLDFTMEKHLPLVVRFIVVMIVFFFVVVVVVVVILSDPVW